MELDDLVNILNKAVTAFKGKMQYAIMDSEGRISVGTIACTETEALTLASLQMMVAQSNIASMMGEQKTFGLPDSELQ